MAARSIPAERIIGAHATNAINEASRTFPRHVGPRRMYDRKTGQEIIVLDG